jgi:hypothetical protein
MGLESERMRLAYGLELVFVLAVGLGLARAQYESPGVRGRLAIQPVSARLRQLGGTALTGMAWAGAVGLWVESIRKRSPRPWGIGRATWAIVGTYAILNTATGLVFALITELRRSGRIPGSDWVGTVVRLYLWQLSGDFTWALVAFWLAAGWAGWMRGGVADAREWAGRAFGGVVVVSSVALRLLQSMGR